MAVWATMVKQNKMLIGTCDNISSILGVLSLQSDITQKNAAIYRPNGAVYHCLVKTLHELLYIHVCITQIGRNGCTVYKKRMCRPVIVICNALKIIPFLF